METVTHRNKRTNTNLRISTVWETPLPSDQSEAFTGLSHWVMFRGSDDKRLQNRIRFPAQCLSLRAGAVLLSLQLRNQMHTVVIITGSYRRSPLLLSACLEKIVFDLCEWAFQVSRFVHSFDTAWQHLEACALISNTSQPWLVMSS